MPSVWLPRTCQRHDVRSVGLGQFQSGADIPIGEVVVIDFVAFQNAAAQITQREPLPRDMGGGWFYRWEHLQGNLVELQQMCVEVTGDKPQELP